MNWINSHSRVEVGVRVGSCRISRLRFADDLGLLASSQQGLQHALDRFSAVSDRAGMKINTKKAEVLCLSGNPRKNRPQKVFNRGLCVCAVSLDLLKFGKNSTDL